MGKFLVELKASDEKKSFTLDFKNEEDAKEWGKKQAEHWKWQSTRVIATPIIAPPPEEKKKEEKPKAKKTKKEKVLS